MSQIDRRSFMRGLAGLFGAASIPDLQARILDAGAPILLKPLEIGNRFHIWEGGLITFGDHDADTFPRVSWGQYFVDLGATTKDDMTWWSDQYGVDPEDLIGDREWSGIYELQYEPAAMAYNFLKRHKVGKRLRKADAAGRLDFFAGSNHPGSNDQWVEAYDDLSVSLLQARLIELKKPIEIVMEVPTVIKLDDFDHDSEPADE